jgi:hypothetical protein
MVREWLGPAMQGMSGTAGTRKVRDGEEDGILGWSSQAPVALCSATLVAAWRRKTGLRAGPLSGGGRQDQGWSDPGEATQSTT